ncbi:GNAT family N-acetyltransferase [Dietzia sp. B32]|uniref:GNAT family N-acetyltransferase n=1 Tax=Dietzia sp. B32 TaxID=2915130 RepID=UPI0037C0C2B9
MSNNKKSADTLFPEDAKQLAKLHIRSFPDFFLSSLGERFLAEFYRAYATDPTAVTVVARDDSGTPIGAVVGTSEPAGFYSRLLRRRLFRFAFLAGISLLGQPRSAPRVIRGLAYRGEAPENGADWALLASLCVDPDLQGSGIGKHLTTDWLHRASLRGIQVAFLTTDAIGNDSVNAFYRSQGWRIDASYTTRQGRTMNRYVIDITPEL